MNSSLEAFLPVFLNEIREDNAAVFAGAGLSASAGYVDWRALLKPIAEDLELDVDKEADLIAIAQYHVNHNAGNRHQLSQLLIEKIGIAAEPTPNHRILASLPIRTYWTTNYDRLIEKALADAGKVADVKYVTPHLATTRARRDVVLYKMHGDIEHPHEAVLTKDDYETYSSKRGAFITALSGDLVSKTFLFLGFSFTDPNLDYVLGRIRTTFQQNQRRHYCIVRRRKKIVGETDEDFAYATRKQSLWSQDLLRFNIKTVFVDEYSEVTQFLALLHDRYRMRTIFVSGSAAEFGAWTKEGTERFLRDLGAVLIQKGYRIATGIGLGVSDALITGAIEQIYRDRAVHIDDALVMRPFPRSNPDPRARQEVWEAYRQELISNAGISLVFLGNKRLDGHIVPADGVNREYEIAQEHGLRVVPIGSSGYVAEELWRTVMADFDGAFPNAPAGLRELVDRLGRPVDSPEQLLSVIVDVLRILSEE